VQQPDRVAGARELIGRGVDVIVLDDGFQHRRLARNVDVVLVDALRPFGLASVDGQAPVRALLPRGLLREPPSSLRRADLIVITRTESANAAAVDDLERELERIAPGRPIARAALRLAGWCDEHGTRRPLEHLRGREVDVVSALGNPAAFEASVKAAGAIVRDRRVFDDHHRYTRAELDGLPAPGRVLVTSAKDAVKLAPLSVAHFALEVEFELVRGGHVFDALLDALPNPSRTPRGGIEKSKRALT
jgi:tetraacyldisaccharide 4'-kinase